MTKESFSIHFKRTWKDLKDSEIIGTFFFAGHRRVTGHLCGSSIGEQSGLVCKQSFRSYFSHQFKNSLIIHLGKTPKKLMSLNLIKTQLNFTSIF